MITWETLVLYGELLHLTKYLVGVEGIQASFAPAGVDVPRCERNLTGSAIQESEVLLADCVGASSIKALYLFTVS